MCLLWDGSADEAYDFQIVQMKWNVVMKASQLWKKHQLYSHHSGLRCYNFNTGLLPQVSSSDCKHFIWLGLEMTVLQLVCNSFEGHGWIITESAVSWAELLSRMRNMLDKILQDGWSVTLLLLKTEIQATVAANQIRAPGRKSTGRGRWV